MNIISKVTINGKTQINGRYINLTGRVFKIQKKSRTIFDQINAITH